MAYVKSWGPFLSKSSDKEYHVKLRDDGRLSCDCPVWLYNQRPNEDFRPDDSKIGMWYDRECEHILEVLEKENKPKIKLARIAEVNFKEDTIFLPAKPILDSDKSGLSRLQIILKKQKEHKLATIAYDARKHGIHYDELKEMFPAFPQEWTSHYVNSYIIENGRYAEGENPQ